MTLARQKREREYFDVSLIRSELSVLLLLLKGLSCVYVVRNCTLCTETTAAATAAAVAAATTTMWEL